MRRAQPRWAPASAGALARVEPKLTARPHIASLKTLAATPVLHVPKHGKAAPNPLLLIVRKSAKTRAAPRPRPDFRKITMLHMRDVREVTKNKPLNKKDYRLKPTMVDSAKICTTEPISGPSRHSKLGFAFRYLIGIVQGHDPDENRADQSARAHDQRHREELRFAECVKQEAGDDR